MRRRIFFLLLWSSFLFLTAEAQQNGYPKMVVDTTKVTNINLRIISPLSTTYYILPNQYMQTLGYFCKQEIYLQKQTIVPIKFRLGTQASCDFIEHH
jgi:hypothetical protein